MGASVDMILTPAKRTVGYAKKLAEGIKAADASRMPRFGDKVIVTNHPTFVFGHLALYPARVMGFFGLDAASVAVPTTWTDLFKAGVECKDDPAGTIYPSYSDVYAHYLKSHDSAFEALAKLNDSVLMQPVPDEKVRENFPTLGIALLFMLNNHQMMHLGQISAWRRCFGLPSAF